MADKRDRLRGGRRATWPTRLGADPGRRRDGRRRRPLAKADQGAVLVAEFSDLQGYVAAEYARREGIDAAVATAIEEQYLPAGPTRRCRRREAGALVAAAEKVDNLVGAFAVDEAPDRLEGSLRPAPRRGRPGADRRRAGLGHRPLPGPRGGLRAAGASRAPTWSVAMRGHGRRDRRLPVGPPRVPAGHARAWGPRRVRPRWARASERRRSTAAWARAIEAAARQPALPGGLDGGDPPRRASRARRPGDDVTPRAARRRPGRGGAARRRSSAARARSRPRAGRATCGAALDAAGPLAQAVDRFFVDVLVNADDPGVRARRYGLVREAAEVLRGVADFDRITDGGGAR